MNCLNLLYLDRFVEKGPHGIFKKIIARPWARIIARNVGFRVYRLKWTALGSAFDMQGLMPRHMEARQAGTKDYARFYWVVVKELNTSYYDGETS